MAEEKKQEMQPGEGKQGEEELLLPIPGEMAAPFGRVRTRLFPYQGEAIPQKKCTKWLDYGYPRQLSHATPACSFA